MAAGTVLTVLSNIPWGQVIDAAPRIAEGAGRLWEAARNLRKTRAPEPEGPDAAGAPAAEPTESERMQARIADLEATVQAMREQMQASAQVVKELADQNALLVQRIEVARQRVVLLAAAGAVVALALTATLALLWRQIA
jgi:hypothetical protein